MTNKLVRERLESDDGKVVQSYIQHIVQRWGALMTELREEAEAAAKGSLEQEAEMRSVRATAVLAGASAYFDRFVPDSEKDTYMRAAKQWTAMFNVRDAGVERDRVHTDPDGNWLHKEGGWYTPEGKPIDSDNFDGPCPGCGRDRAHPWTRYHRSRCDQRAAEIRAFGPKREGQS